MVAAVGPQEEAVRQATKALTAASALSEEAGLAAARELLQSVQQLYIPSLTVLVLNVVQIAYPMYVQLIDEIIAFLLCSLFLEIFFSTMIPLF